MSARTSPDTPTDQAPDSASAAPPGNPPEAFPPARFDLVAFCEGCGHSAVLARDQLPPGLTVQQLPPRLRCSACGRRPGVLRIIYTGAGGFAHSGVAVVAGS